MNVTTEPQKQGRPKKADDAKGKNRYIPNAVLPYVLAIMAVQKARHADKYPQPAKP